MFLTESHRPALPFKRPRPAAAAPAATKPFDEALAARLRTLLPIPTAAGGAGISLAWLTLAVEVLSRTLADAAALGADPSPLLASHLDSGIALLDACNAISAAVDSLLRRRLHLRFALHLLSSPSAVPRARKSIKEWEDYDHSLAPRADLVRKLRPLDLPRGKIPAVWRAIYAVESVSCLVATSGLAILGAADQILIRAPADFPWAATFNEVAAAVSAKPPCPVAEIEIAEAAARSLAAAIDGGEELSAVAREAERATEVLTEGLERLSDAVSGLFRVALGARKAALQGFRVGPQKGK